MSDGDGALFLVLGVLIAIGMILIAFAIIAGEDTGFRDDCVASGGSFSEIDGSQYCELNGHVYPRDV